MAERRAGTIRCILFGHKFVIVRGYEDDGEIEVRGQSRWCTRCGASRVMDPEPEVYAASEGNK